MSTLVAQLERAGIRVTPARRLIATTVERLRGPFSADVLLRAVRREDTRIGRATVFRTLRLLVLIGAVEHIHVEGDAPAYLYCEVEHRHLHLVCRRCDRIVVIPDSPFVGGLADLEASTGFRIGGRVVEVKGVCANCQT